MQCLHYLLINHLKIETVVALCEGKHQGDHTLREHQSMKTIRGWCVLGRLRR